MYRLILGCVTSLLIRIPFNTFESSIVPPGICPATFTMTTATLSGQTDLHDSKATLVRPSTLASLCVILSHAMSVSLYQIVLFINDTVRPREFSAV